MTPVVMRERLAMCNKSDPSQLGVVPYFTPIFFATVGLSA
jgi:hypothetical protein